MGQEETLLSISLSAEYRRRRGVLEDVRISLRRGEVFGLVGQSGSGKSTLALALLGLLGWKGGQAHGSILFEGRELTKASEREWRLIRGKRIAFVPQSPIASLNPALRLRSQFQEAWRAHERGPLEPETLRDLMRSVSLPDEPGFLKRYPSELSVGQGQRILIAMALLHKPSLIIADEPTSALDVITQAEILALFERLNRESGTAILLISHDLVAVGSLCHRIAVLQEGRMVEWGDARELLSAPGHEYTKRLVQAIPKVQFRALENAAGRMERE